MDALYYIACAVSNFTIFAQSQRRFSIYFDKGLISAVLAAVSWHLRALVPGKYGHYFAVVAVCLLALGNVFFTPRP